MPLFYKTLFAASVAAALFFSSSSVNAQASAYAADYNPEQLNRGIPNGLIADTQNNPYLIWVSLQQGRLHILQREDNNQYLEIENIPISIGKQGFGKEYEGDQKTPVGIYRVTSFLGDSDLDDFYGLGAYPIDYPNTWDKLSARTGYGIWLHGLPKGIDQRPLLDSNGCVVIDNSKLQQYSQFITTGNSTMVLAETLDWRSTETKHPSDDVMQAIDQWKADWESTDAGDYLRNYHTDFTDFTRNLEQWKTYKSRVNGAKSYIRVELSDLSVFAYPGEENLVTSRFYQNYQSSNYNWKGWKQMLWQRDADGQWRIIYEGNG